MKRILTFFFAISIATLSSANIVIPGPFTAELYFDSTSNWVIELGFYGWETEFLDSMQVKCNSGIATIMNSSLFSGEGTYPGYDSLAIITNANLDSALSLNF